MSSYRMDFKEFVIKARPNIKENSVHAYARSLRLLAPEDAISLDFLRDTVTPGVAVGWSAPPGRWQLH